MNILVGALILICISFLTFVTTYLTKEYLTSKNLLVIPGLRSSHKEPKPQGGGLSIIFILSLSLLVLDYLGLVNKNDFLFFLLPGLLVAFIGYLDDFWEIRPSIRICVHIISACLGIYLIGGFPVITLLDLRIDLGVLGIVLGLIYIVWFINLFNFMDGIDGMVSLETISVLCIFSIISYSLQIDLSFIYIFLL